MIFRSFTEEAACFCQRACTLLYAFAIKRKATILSVSTLTNQEIDSLWQYNFDMINHPHCAHLSMSWYIFTCVTQVEQILVHLAVNVKGKAAWAALWRGQCTRPRCLVIIVFWNKKNNCIGKYTFTRMKWDSFWQGQGRAWFRCICTAKIVCKCVR